MKDIAAGSHHCLALTSDGTVLGWGRNTNPDSEAGTRGSVAVPTVLAAASKIGVVTISCGRHEVQDVRGLKIHDHLHGLSLTHHTHMPAHTHTHTHTRTHTHTHTHTRTHTHTHTHTHAHTYTNTHTHTSRVLHSASDNSSPSGSKSHSHWTYPGPPLSSWICCCVGCVKDSARKMERSFGCTGTRSVWPWGHLVC